MAERPRGGGRGSGGLGLGPAQAALSVGAYMSAVGGSIVNAVLPSITQALQVDVALIEWVLVVYLLVLSGLLLSFGRLGDLYGHKRVYQSGMVVFAVGSALCGLAPTAYLLIAARALQAVGGAMLFASAPAIVALAVPSHQRGRALGIQGTSIYLGLASGPPLGGWLADSLGWRSVFFISLPLAVVALGLGSRFIPPDRPSKRGETFDVAGATFYMAGLMVLLLGLNQGHAWGWTSAAVLSCFAIGLALLGVFVVLQLRGRSPMLQLRLFRVRAFTAPVLSAVFNYFAVSSTFFLTPFYLVDGRGLSLAQAGLVMTAQPIVMSITATLSGAFSDRVGSRLPATLGMTVLSSSLLGYSLLAAAAPIPLLAANLALVGLGIGLFTSPNNSAVMGAVPSDQRGVASGILSTARALGNVVGVGVAGAIFNSGLSHGGAHEPAEVVPAVSMALAVAAGVAALGAITSFTRPSSRPNRVGRT